MELNQLRMFLTLLDAGSYVAAGERLHVAHSAIHRQVRLLEEELGHRLVYRNRGVTQATAAGREVAESARRALKDISNLSSRLAGKATLSSGCVNLGTGTTMLLYLLPELLSSFRKAYPRIDIHIVTGAAPDILMGIRDSSLDLGIIFADSETPPSEEGIRFDPLSEEELVLILPPSHSFKKVRSISQDALQGLPLISLSRASRLRHMIERRLQRAQVGMHTVMELENEEAIERMVGADFGVGFISRRRAQCMALRYVQIPELNLRAMVCLAHSTRIPMSPAARHFLAACLQSVPRRT